MTRPDSSVVREAAAHGPWLCGELDGGPGACVRGVRRGETAELGQCSADSHGVDRQPECRYDCPSLSASAPTANALRPTALRQTEEFDAALAQLLTDHSLGQFRRRLAAAGFALQPMLRMAASPGGGLLLNSLLRECGMQRAGDRLRLLCALAPSLAQSEVHQPADGLADGLSQGCGTTAALAATTPWHLLATLTLRVAAAALLA